MDIEAIKEREKAYHERVRTGLRPFPRLDVEGVRRELLTPTWAGGMDRYNEARREFHALIESRGGFAGRQVLDYGCGNGMWSLYMRLRGAARVVGVDIAEIGLARGMRRVSMQEESRSVHLVCGDVERLPLADASFDLAVGHGVLHHVIKYPGIFDELHRVLRPGARGYFLENLADNPIFRLYWHFKGEIEEGDVPIFAAEVRRLAHAFAEVEVIGTDFFHSIATYLFRQPLSTWRKAVLRTTHRLDEMLFRVIPASRKWGCLSIIVIEKDR